MTTTIKAAVLSAGKWLDCDQAPALKGDKRVELVALSSPNTEMAEALGRQFEVPLIVADWREALATKPDIVVVSSPPVAHEEQVIAALEAGAHVLVEKPFALSSGPARRMRDAAERLGKALLVGFGWPARS